MDYTVLTDRPFHPVGDAQSRGDTLQGDLRVFFRRQRGCDKTMPFHFKGPDALVNREGALAKFFEVAHFGESQVASQTGLRH
jgi:hypothetical protein